MENQQHKALGDFDPHVVHHRDERTKRVVKVNPYRLFVHKGTRYFEWPKGSGNLWYENREPAGRLSESGEPVIGAKHEDFEPPMTADEQLAIQQMSLEQENRRLQAELTAIKKEREGDAAIARDAASKASVKKVESKTAAKPKEEVKAPTKK